GAWTEHRAFLGSTGEASRGRSDRCRMVAWVGGFYERIKDATLVTALFPAGAKATILAGLRHDSATYRSAGQYVADKGVTLRFGVRVYIGGGK
ncbi:MAG: hypothetical protein Q8N51_07440, partial [Gammaproteobacteria bacterium]|nr:hypothetical protein [Gammaproteobacteria bacterium]